MIKLTSELENQFKEHEIADLKDCLWDNEIIAMFYYPSGSGTWLIVGAEQMGEDWLLYGYCHITEWEWGSVSFNELSSVEVKGYSIKYMIPSVSMTVQQFKDDFLVDDYMKYPYEDFCNTVVDFVKLHTEPTFHEMVHRDTVTKTNLSYECVYLPVAENLCLTINLGQVFSNYNNMPLSFVELLNCLIYDFHQFANNTPENYLDIKSGTIKGLLINTKKNEEYLKKVPNRSFLDLSLIYYLDSDERTIVITNTLAEILNVSELELYESALDNMEEYYYKDFCDFSWMKELSNVDATRKLFVLTNKSGFKASAGLLSSKIAELSEELDSSLYIIPSSVHEYVITPCDIPEEMVLCMHREVITMLHDEDYLSDNVYRYDKHTQELSVVN